MIAGGGTGGHLFPGIAVAETLRCRDPEGAILFVGSARGLEARVVPETGFALETLPIAPLRGQKVAARVRALAALGAATWRSRRLLARFAPDAVIGLGGYASAPAVVAARLAGTPIVLLEQNARPGITTRALARLADRVCVSFPESATRFSAARAVVTGNPVRWRAPAEPAAASGRAGFTILVFGGSAGARRLNTAAPALLAGLAAMGDVRLIHQTGVADEAAVRAAYAGTAPVEVHAFIADMGRAYAAADLVICRAGATTVAELAGLGKPAILVPYPFAADDHQRANAEALVRVGAARMVLDAEATGERLAAEARELRTTPGALDTMARSIRAFARPDAADRIVDTVVELVRRRGGGS
jgi:UDP-N-acetylglucosamine--N-acetylmuramyl-(pentapeptide) pyrophosphoryl-undecaprenol N-acetylglucosamine transferase